MQKHKTSMFSQYENNSNNSITSRQLEYWLMQMAPTSHTSPQFGKDWNLMSTSSRYQPDGMTFAARLDTFNSANKQNISSTGNLVERFKEIKENDSHAQSLNQENSGEDLHKQGKSKLKSKSYINAMQDLQRRARTLEQQNFSMKKSIAFLQQDKRNSLQSSLVVSEQMQHKISELQCFQKKTEQLRRQNKKLKDNKNQQSTKLKLMQKTISQQTQKCKLFQERLNNLSSQNQNLKKQLSQANIHAQSLVSENKHLSIKTDTLQNMKQKSTNSILEKYSKSLEKIEQLELQIGQLKNKHKAEKQQHKKSIKDDLKKYKQLQTLLNESKLQNERLKMKIENFQQTKNQSLQKLNEVKYENKQLQHKLSNQNEQLAKFQKKYLKLLQTIQRVKQPSTKLQSPSSIEKVQQQSQYQQYETYSQPIILNNSDEKYCNQAQQQEQQMQAQGHFEITQVKSNRSSPKSFTVRINRQQEPLIKSSDKKASQKSKDLQQGKSSDSLDEQYQSQNNVLKSKFPLKQSNKQKSFKQSNQDRNCSNLPRKNNIIASTKSTQNKNQSSSLKRTAITMKVNNNNNSRGKNSGNKQQKNSSINKQQHSRSFEEKPRKQRRKSVNSITNKNKEGKSILKQSKFVIDDDTNKQNHINQQLQSVATSNLKQHKGKVSNSKQTNNTNNIHLINVNEQKLLRSCQPIHHQYNYQIEEEQYEDQNDAYKYNSAQNFHRKYSSNSHPQHYYYANEINGHSTMMTTTPNDNETMVLMNQSSNMVMHGATDNKYNATNDKTCSHMKNAVQSPCHQTHTPSQQQTQSQQQNFNKVMLYEYQQEALRLYEEHQQLLEKSQKQTLTTEEKSELMGRIQQVMEMINRNTEKMFQLKAKLID